MLYSSHLYRFLTPFIGADIDAVSPVCNALVTFISHSNESQGSVTEHVYGVLLKLYEKYPDKGMRSRVLQCMGSLDIADFSMLPI